MSEHIYMKQTLSLSEAASQAAIQRSSTEQKQNLPTPLFPPDWQPSSWAAQTETSASSTFCAADKRRR